jgi:TolB-like protein
MKNGSAATSTALAVLPFENLSGEDRFNYFSRELVEELIIDLSHFPALEIISSYTSSRLNDPDLDEIEEAKKISVDYLLKGSLHLQPDSIRLTTQLLETNNRKIIWADRFDSPLDSIFEIQKNIVERVVFTISAEVDNNLLKSAREKPVTNLAAYECWLRGMDRLRLGTLEADHQAREFFNQALTIDPNYSRAYVGLSLSHFNEWSCQLWEIYEQSEKSAYNYAAKAFQLDDSDHIVQMILGRVYIYRRQFEEAEYHIDRSLELNSNDADTLVQLATCMAFLGRAAEGERLFKKALRLNPYRNLWYYQYGSFTYFVQKKYQKAIEMALKRQIEKAWVDLPAEIAAAYAHLGRNGIGQKISLCFY